MDANAILEAFEQAGYPVGLVELPGGTWEVTVKIEGTSGTLFARAATREAAIEHAASTLFPSIIAKAITKYFQARRGQNVVPVESRSSLMAPTAAIGPAKTKADQFGGFGINFRFNQEEDGSYSWAVFDDAGDTAFGSGVSDSLDDAKLAALANILPPNWLEATKR